MAIPTARVANIDRILAVDARFTAFNSRRTFLPDDSRLETVRAGRAIGLRDAARADLYYNRVLGLGEAELTHLDELIAFHEELDRPSALTLTPDRCSPALLRALRERRYSLHATHCVFVSKPTPQAPHDASFQIRQARPEDLEAVVALWTQDEAPPEPEVVARRASSQWNDAFPIYLASIDGALAAMATLFVYEGVAWLANANTRPDFRGRGGQLALVQHRLGEAARMGCDLAVSDAAFGTTSHRNLERAGMRLAYQEVTLRRPSPGSASM